MKYLIFWLIILTCNLTLLAQKQAAIWFLGHGNGIDFSVNPPKLIGSAPEERSSFATIADLDGNMLLYSNGSTVWNRDHQIIDNGTGLQGNGYLDIFIQNPGNDSQYYLFQLDRANDILESAVIYSLIDINAKAGKGKVIKKNILLYKNLHGSFTVSGDCETGYWLVGETNTNIEINGSGSDKIYAFRITKDSLFHTPVVSEPVSIGHSFGYLFSPDGSKLIFNYSGNGPDGVGIADFNKLTGEVSNLFELQNCCGSGVFSADGKYLYINSRSEYELRQFDLNNLDKPYVVIASGYPYLGEPQLAADGKIYYPVSSEKRKLGVIEFPEKEGLASYFHIDEIFEFPNPLNTPHLPKSATNLLYKNPKMPDAGPDLEVCSGEDIQLSVANASLDNIEWIPHEFLDNPYAVNPIFSYDNPYDSTVEFTYKIKSCEDDQVKIKVYPTPRPEINGSRSVCPWVEQIDYWTAYKEDYTYEWRVDGGELIYGQGTDSIRVNWGPTNSDAKVRLVATNKFNCKNEEVIFNVRINVELETEQPQGLQEVCNNKMNDNIYQILPTRGSNYKWEIQGGIITEGQGTNKVVVKWDSIGDHWIRVLEESTTIDTICFGISPKLEVKVYKDSLKLQIDYLTLNDTEDTQVELYGKLTHAEENADFPIHIFRKPEDAFNWESLSSIIFPEDSLGFWDRPLQTSESVYEYYLQTVNGCDEIVESTAHNTIKLAIDSSQQSGVNQLKWNAYNGWGEGVKNYEVYRMLDAEENFELVGATSENELTFPINNEQDGFHHTFRIKAKANNKGYFSWSNRISLEFEHPLFIPNVFTPNGDGVNDTFMMDPIHLYVDNHLIIINRWGEEVYRKSNYQGDWTGEELGSGIYYYSIYIDKVQRMYRGWVHIMK